MKVLSCLKKLFQPKEEDVQFPKNALYIDVSPAFDFEQEQLDGSINIPLENLHSTVGVILKYTVPIVIISNCEELTDEAVDILFDAGVLAYNSGDWRNL